MAATIESITIPSLHNEAIQKKIVFEVNGKKNVKQHRYINALFEPVLDAQNKLRIVVNTLVQHEDYAYFGAFRCGKSFAQQLAVFLLAKEYAKCKIVYIRDTYDQLKDTVIPQFRDEFEYLGHFTYHKSDRICIFRNGSFIRFRAFDKDTNILSAEYDVIAMCQAEDIPEELYLQAIGRTSGRILPRSIVLTEGNPASTWVKRKYKDAKQNELEKDRIFFLEGETRDNPFVTEEYIEKLERKYPENWKQRYLYGNWDNIDEMVFSEFREKEHVVDPIELEYTKNFKHRQGLDYGIVNPTAIIWGYVDYDGALTIYAEWGGTHKTTDEIAKAAKQYGQYPIVADYSIKRPESSGRSVWDDLKRSGLRLIESNKQELQNIGLANMLLKNGRLRIAKNCEELIGEIKRYKWKRLKLGSEKNHPETPVDKDNHYIDALLYLIASLEQLRSIDPKEEEYKRSLEWKVIQKGRQNNADVFS